MMRTLEIQAQVVARVRALAGGADVVVSPLTLAAHEPSCPTTTIDARVGSEFAAAWTVGSVCALASVAVRVRDAARGASTGPCSRPRGSRARSGSCRRARDGSSTWSRSSDPRRVGAIAAAGMPLLLANLTPEPQEVRLEGTASGGRVLGPYEVAEVARSPR